jgi:hypothetical protein
MFLKLKQETSEYSTWLHIEVDEDIEDYRRAESIVLDKVSVFKMAGERTLGKLKLNSIWGKCAQNQKKTQTSLITSESFTVLRLQT